MASTYVNNLRLEEMATGEKSGTWGTISNTNLELIAQAWGSGTESFATDADTTVTIQDGTSDDARAFYLNVTSGVSLTATRTMTLAPNTVNKVWIIKNSTSGSQSINISQGSGANATIANGETAVIYTDGGGSGANVYAIDLVSGSVSGDLNFGDNVKALFGDSQDLQIYHDGSHSYIDDTGTGSLILRGNGAISLQKYTGETMGQFTADGAVALYYDNAQKFTTTSSGVTVTGTVIADGVSLGDNESAYFGTGNDFQIFHDGSNTYLTESGGVGNVYLRANNLVLVNNSNETYVNCVSDGAVTLYYDNSVKLATTSTGVSVTGTVLSSDGQFGLDSTDYIQFVNNSYLRFIVNGGEEARLESDGDLHVDGDVIAYSTTISDERLKENIYGIEGALDKVNQLNGYTFTYKADGKVSAGVIAQEVEKVLPEAVSEKELPLKVDDEEKYKVVNYDALHGLLIEAIKELKAEIEELKNGSTK
jgi:hypothetical protein